MTARVATELSRSEKIRYGQILGFIVGDGSVGKEKNDVRFSNSNMACMRRMLENFAIVFGAEREGFRYYLELPIPAVEEEVLKSWKAELGVPISKIRRGKKTKKKNGLLLASMYNRQIRDEILSGIDRVFKEEEKCDSVLLGFIMGFFAAEGAIIPGKTRKEIPNSIQLPQKGKKIPGIISRILDKFDVDNRVVIKQKKADYYCVNITGFENFERFFRLGMAGMHDEKEAKLERGLNSYTKKVSRKLKLPTKLLIRLNTKPMTRYEIYDFMGLYPQRINGMLYSKDSFLVKNGLIKREQGCGNVITWDITEKGRAFLEKAKPF